MPIEDSRPKQIFRLDSETKRTFEQVCASRDISQQAVLERFVTAFCRNAATYQVYHLDGTECPLSVMLSALGSSLRSEFEMRSGSLFKQAKSPG